MEHIPLATPIRAARRAVPARLVLGLALWAACARADPAPPVVTLLGDSIAAGHGLPAADALPAQLQAALAEHGVRVTVRGAGVSGDTASGGLARVGFSVQSDTALCIVELGGNDYLQSVPPEETRASLTGIVDDLKARHIRVLLLGGMVPAAGSGSYGTAFNAIFPDLARAARVTLEPDFLAGVLGVPALMQPDGIHPDAAGVRVMADRMVPFVTAALKN